MGVLDLAAAVLGHADHQATGNLAHNVVETIHTIACGAPTDTAGTS